MTDGQNGSITVFTYGTLMKGRCNHSRYLSNAEFIGEAVAEGFDLYDLGRYPGVIRSDGGKIKGELYRIEASKLAELDELEGEGELYLRCLTDVSCENETIQDVCIYVYNHDISAYSKVSFENQPWG